jgi:hypothetical protein
LAQLKQTRPESFADVEFHAKPTAGATLAAACPPPLSACGAPNDLPTFDEEIELTEARWPAPSAAD